MKERNIVVWHMQQIAIFRSPGNRQLFVNGINGDIDNFYVLAPIRNGFGVLLASDGGHIEADRNLSQPREPPAVREWYKWGHRQFLCSRTNSQRIRRVAGE